MCDVATGWNITKVFKPTVGYQIKPDDLSTPICWIGQIEGEADGEKPRSWKSMVP